MCVDRNMKRSLAIDSHQKFHLTVLRTVAAGGLLGGLHGVVGPATSYLADLGGLHGAWAWLYGASAVLLLGAAAVPPASKRGAAALVGCAVLGGLSTGLAACAAAAGCTVGGSLGLAVALGLYMATGELPGGRWQALLSGLAGAGMALVAQRIPPALMAQDFMLELPTPAASLLAGLGMGLAVGSATIGRYLKVKLEPMDKELKGLLPAETADDEISKLVAQAMTSYQQAADCLAEHPQARATAEQLVKKVARFGKKWQDIEVQARKSDRPKLDQRIADGEGPTNDYTATLIRGVAAVSERPEVRSLVRTHYAEQGVLHDVDPARDQRAHPAAHQVGELGEAPFEKERRVDAATDELLRHQDVVRLARELDLVPPEARRLEEDPADHLDVRRRLDGANGGRGRCPWPARVGCGDRQPVGRREAPRRAVPPAAAEAGHAAARRTHEPSRRGERGLAAGKSREGAASAGRGCRDARQPDARRGSTVLKVYFDNILLPDSGTNQWESDGVFGYSISIKPWNTYPSYPFTIENTAHVYFDFNPPVATNTETTLVEISVGLHEQEVSSVMVYPNPVYDVLNLNLSAIASQHRVSVVDITGKMLSEQVYTGNRISIPVQQLQTGMYLVKVSDTQSGNYAVQRFTKY